MATESNTMRLGGSLQSKTFIAGVAGKAVIGNTVLITGSGQLGVLLSSARYKQDIAPLGDQSDKLEQLRPVTFHYKDDSTGTLQYGLIAEEVAKVYPELVTRDEDGAIEGVRYDELTPLLLHALQRQQQTLQQQKQRLTTQQQELAALQTQNAQLQATLAQRGTEQREHNTAVAARLERLEAAAQGTTVAQR